MLCPCDSESWKFWKKKRRNASLGDGKVPCFDDMATVIYLFRSLLSLRFRQSKLNPFTLISSYVWVLRYLCRCWYIRLQVVCHILTPYLDPSIFITLLVKTLSFIKKNNSRLAIFFFRARKTQQAKQAAVWSVCWIFLPAYISFTKFGFLWDPFIFVKQVGCLKRRRSIGTSRTHPS